MDVVRMNEVVVWVLGVLDKFAKMGVVDGNGSVLKKTNWPLWEEVDKERPPNDGEIMEVVSVLYVGQEAVMLGRLMGRYRDEPAIMEVEARKLQEVVDWKDHWKGRLLSKN